MARNSRLYLLLLFVFVLSGAAGLVYQSIWTQYLGLFLGHAAYAQSLVLILFMGGMGLGAWLVSRISERISRPLMVYAAIEFVLGVFGLTFDAVYRTTTEFAYTHIFAGSSPVTVGLVRWGLASLLILPQCILLGATFPLMSAGCLRHMPESGGRVLGGLYFSNSIGAAGGALLATFFLLPTVGLPGTLLTAALFNIAVAMAAWMPGKEVLPGRVADTAAGAAMAPAIVLLTAAITGLTSFVYEVVWVRMLAVVVGSTIHAFELMLTAFISGLAFGGLYLKSRADKFENPLRSVAWIQILMGLAALLSLWLYSSAFSWVAQLMGVLNRNDAGYTLFNFSTAVICLLIMFPAAFFAGMTLPLLTLTLLRRGGERVIGQVYSANTLGCIFGVLLAVHLMMPMFGVKYALWVAAGLDLMLGVALFLNRGTESRSTRRATLAFAISAAALVVTAACVKFDPLQLASSVYRLGAVTLPPGSVMRYYRDGKTASVAMYDFPKKDLRAVATNGKVDAAANVDLAGARSPDEFTMVLAAMIPLAYLPDTQVVGVIGFGSGMTTHTLLASSTIKRVDTIEIEPSMIEASRNFEKLSERAYTDPRSHIVIDDAKAYFAASQEKYDVIVSEPSNPWVSGVATLFTQEFYRFVPNHLSERGIFVQWLQLYEITPDLVATVVKALLPHFEDIQVYMTNSSDMLIVAKPKGKLPELDATLFRDEAMQLDGKRIGIQSLADLKRHQLMNGVGLAAFANVYSSNANSDFFPILQLGAPRARFEVANTAELSNLQAVRLPVLEVAGQYTPEPVGDLPPNFSAMLPRTAALMEAHDVRRLMLGENLGIPKNVSSVLLGSVMVTRDFARRCDNEDESKLWFANAINAANASIPMMGPGDLKGVWIDPAWAKDCKAPTAFAQQGLALFAALAQRDWVAVDAATEKLLTDPHLDKIAGIKRYLLSSKMVAKFALNDNAQVAALAQVMAKEPGGASFYEKWLHAFSNLRSGR